MSLYPGLSKSLPLFQVQYSLCFAYLINENMHFQTLPRVHNLSRWVPEIVFGKFFEMFADQLATSYAVP